MHRTRAIRGGPVTEIEPGGDPTASLAIEEGRIIVFPVAPWRPS